MQWTEIVRDRETALQLLCAAAACENALRACPGARQPLQSAPQPVWMPERPAAKPAPPAVSRIAPRPSASKRRDGRKARRACRCGACQRCIENARWERVFNEKFLDQDYYRDLRLLQRSPLAGL